MKLWQLINPQTGENIGDPQPLPENWGPIFGMEGIKDKLNDLSWLGINDRCWIEVEVPNPPSAMKEHVDLLMLEKFNEAKNVLSNSSVLTKAQWQSWVEYQQKIQEIPLQPDYPNEVLWPTRPE